MGFRNSPTVPNSPPGVYFLREASDVGRQVSTRKVVIQR